MISTMSRRIFQKLIKIDDILIKTLQKDYIIKKNILLNRMEMKK